MSTSYAPSRLDICKFLHIVVPINFLSIDGRVDLRTTIIPAGFADCEPKHWLTCGESKHWYAVRRRFSQMVGESLRL
jgi:hypothetical protein